VISYDVTYDGDDATGWSAFVPDLPGVGVTGDTKDEVRDRLAKAIELHLCGMREDRLAIPTPTRIDVDAMIAGITPENLNIEREWIDAPSVGKEIVE
jgi:predicted RNase H-like HicB family nuclease